MKVTNTTGVDFYCTDFGAVVADGETIDTTEALAAQLVAQGWKAKPEAKTPKTPKADAPTIEKEPS